MLRSTFRIALLGALIVAAVPAVATAEPIRNIVLVHGAWVDASGWRGVYDILTARGYNVTMVQEPLTSLAADVAATRRVLDALDGPAVLVGHSYGGSVITEAGADPHVAALVYVAAHAPDVGEDEAALGRGMPSDTQKIAGAVVRTSDGFTTLRPDLFPVQFATDLDPARARFQALSQVPTAAAVFATPLTTAAWRTKPSWGIVAGGDRIINPDLGRFYYRRAGSHETVIDGASHAVFESHPAEVAAVIEQAASSQGR